MFYRSTAVYLLVDLPNVMAWNNSSKALWVIYRRAFEDLNVTIFKLTQYLCGNSAPDLLGFNAKPKWCEMLDILKIVFSEWLMMLFPALSLLPALNKESLFMPFIRRNIEAGWVAVIDVSELKDGRLWKPRLWPKEPAPGMGGGVGSVVLPHREPQSCYWLTCS